MSNLLPILYSFRRCPYAMRARMAIYVSGQQCELREVVLRDKPEAMIEVSPKATVPVLQLPDGRVIDESVDIMIWALALNDPWGWRGAPDLFAQMVDWIRRTQSEFKGHLDRYKYPSRYERDDPNFLGRHAHRDAAVVFLSALGELLGEKPFLFDPAPKLADIAIFPFVRQFANTDREWFHSEVALKPIQGWLDRCLELPCFDAVMKKYAQWQPGDALVTFPD